MEIKGMRAKYKLRFDCIYNPDTFGKHFDNVEFKFKQMTKIGIKL